MNLLEKQTAAATSDTFDLTGSNKSGVAEQTFRVIGSLGTDEYVTLYYHDGDDWRAAKMDGNDGKILDADNAVATVYGRMTDVRVSKSVTATAVGVEVV